ncbi:hypothetical protein [Lentzea sp. E54]|uniref:hypothetical protein n=1 Tax=Lentzea xerophila TaxID=3435883 RepID=UPI003DA37A6C
MVFGFARRPEDDEPVPPGWFADPLRLFDRRYIDQDERSTGHVMVQLWDPKHGPDPQAEFWLSGRTAALSLVGDRLVVLSHADRHRRGSARLTLPSDACQLLVEPDGDDLRVIVRFELGFGESPTMARGMVYLLFHPDQEAALRRCARLLHGGTAEVEEMPPFLRVEEPSGAVEVAPVVVEVAPVVVEEPVVAKPVAAPPSVSSLPRLVTRTAPDSADWICFRPGPAHALVTVDRWEVERS